MNIVYINPERVGMPVLKLDTDSTVKRVLSLEPDFMSHRRDDRLYACLLTLSTYNPDEDIVYVSKERVSKKKKEIMDICNYNSRTTFYRNVEKWNEVGLIEEAIIDGEYCWVLNNRTDFGKYQLISLELVRYMIWTCSTNTFRIYAYLLNKWVWKKRGIYEFTIKELSEICGYSSKDSYKTVGTILENMQRIGLIRIEVYYKNVIDDMGTEYTTSIRQLTFMAEQISQLPAVVKCI